MSETGEKQSKMAMASEIDDDKETIEMARSNLREFLRPRVHWNRLMMWSEGDHQYLYGILVKHPSLASERIHGFKINIQDSTAEAIFPFVFLLAARAPLNMLKEVYDMHPDVISRKQVGWGYPLHTAIQSSASIEVVQFVLSKYKWAASEVDIDDALPIHYLLIEELGHVADPSDPETWKIAQLLIKNASLDHLMQTRRHNGTDFSILGRCLCNPQTPAWFLSWCGEEVSKHCGSALIASLDENRNGAGVCLQNIKHFVSALQNDQVLVFQRCALSLNSMSCILGEMLLPVEDLVFVYCSIGRYEADAAGGLWSHWNSKECQLKSLEFSNGWVCPKYLDFLLRNGHSMPNLKTLKLKYYNTGGFDCTGGVLALLQNGHLDHLSIQGVKMDEEQVSTFLESSDVVTPQFEYVPDWFCGGRPSHKIAYLSCLNKQGKRKLEAMDATPDLLMDCLSSLDDKSDHFGLQPSLQYGLLREVPSLWASSTGKHKGSKESNHATSSS